MNNWKTTRDFILDVEQPVKEGKYCPIPHSVFLNQIQDKLFSRNYTIKDERYLTTNNGKVIFGTFRINSDADVELAPSISFINSYNKMRKAEIRASATVLVCKNGMIAEMTKGYYSRKHFGDSALTDFENHIDSVIDRLEEEFQRLITNKNEMKSINLTNQNKSELIGDMLLYQNLITPTQLSIASNEINTSVNFKDDSLWSFYNNITESYKDNHPMLYDKQHIKFHTYITDKFDLTGSKGLYNG